MLGLLMEAIYEVPICMDLSGMLRIVDSMTVGLVIEVTY
jgi:hypothetical protein